MGKGKERRGREGVVEKGRRGGADKAFCWGSGEGDGGKGRALETG